MSNKTFSIAGYSKLTNGQYKARFANNSIKGRSAILVRAGHTEINFVELPQPMTKVAAAQYLLDTLKDIPPGAGVALKHTLNSAGSDDAEEAVNEVVAEVKATKAKAKSKTAATA